MLVRGWLGQGAVLVRGWLGCRVSTGMVIGCRVSGLDYTSLVSHVCLYQLMHCSEDGWTSINL